MKSKDWIEKLELSAHPEGGYFSEFHRSESQIEPEGFGGLRSCSTAIYFLLEKGQFSALHRIKSDEVWHFYDGDPLEIIEIDSERKLKVTILGRDIDSDEMLSYVVRAGNWFGSRPAPKSEYALVGCTVSPGFDFSDFEMPLQSYFLEKFPEHRSLILEMTRKTN